MSKKSSKITEKQTSGLAGDTGGPEIQTVDEAADGKAFIERLYGEQAKLLVPFALVVGCLMIYFQVYRFDFINFDDNLYVYQNAVVQGGLSWSGFKWAFTTFDATNWHPLTWLSHQLDITLFGLEPGRHHVMSAFYHTINSVVLFFTVRFLTGTTWRSAIVAAIFAFHPGHVESVAWVSERKDLLSALFFFLTIYAYAIYVKDGASKKWYIAALVLFALGLMSKPMLVTLPFVLLLLDYWPLKRIEKFSGRELWPVLLDKLPMFAMVVGSSIATFNAQKAGGAVVPLGAISLWERMTNALLSYVKYLGTLFYPVNLAGWYPYQETYPLWQIGGALAILAGITFYASRHLKDKRYFAVGWFWYVGMLVPVIGLVQVGGQAYADRYTYLPFVGLSIALVWLVHDWIEKFKINRDVVSALVLVLVIALGALSFRQAAFWKDTETFYQHALAITERTFLFEQNYCNYLLRLNRLDEAEVQCRNSIAHNPAHVNAHISLGVVLMQKGRNEEGLNSFETAWKLQPNDVQAYANWVNALISLKRYDEAEAGILKLENWDGDRKEVDDRLYKVYKMIGLAYGLDGKPEKAIVNLRKAVGINPFESDVHSNLGMLIYEQGKTDEAYVELMFSLEINPNQADIQNAVGRILAFQKKWDAAIERFKKSLEIDPKNENAAKNLREAEAAKKAAK